MEQDESATMGPTERSTPPVSRIISIPQDTMELIAAWRRIFIQLFMDKKVSETIVKTTESIRTAMRGPINEGIFLFFLFSLLNLVFLPKQLS